MLNSITIMGRLVRDPEYRATGNGTSVANFTVAVDRDFSGQGGEKETDFIDCVAWRNTAEFITRFFTKGSMIVVNGRLQVRNWTDKDGNRRKTSEIVAESAYFGEWKKQSAGGMPESQYQPPVSALIPGGDYPIIDEEDGQLPF